MESLVELKNLRRDLQSGTSCFEAEAEIEKVQWATAVALAGPLIDGVRPPPGLPPPSGLPSHGSLLHASGRCKPCMWFWKPAGCGNALDCGHCHMCPHNELTIRKRKRRAQARRAEVTKGISQAPLMPSPPQDSRCGFADFCKFSQGSPVHRQSPLSSECDAGTHCDSDEESLLSSDSPSLASRVSRNQSPISLRILDMNMGSPPQSIAWRPPPGIFSHVKHDTVMSG